jgi:hypothetical protein
MTMLALIAAKEGVAVASGLAAGLVPPLSASSLDGFAVGMLLSGGVFLLITVHNQGPRRPGRASADPVGDGLAAAQPDGLAPAQPGGAELAAAELVAPGAASTLVTTGPASTPPARLATAGSASSESSSAGSASAELASSELTSSELISVAAASAAAGDPAEFSAEHIRFGRAGLRRASAGRRRGGARRPDTAEPGQELGEYPSPPLEPGQAQQPDADGGEDRPSPGDREEEHGPAAQRGLSRRAAGYQSRHRLSSQEDSKPWPSPDGRRRTARHAAPSSPRTRRMSTLAQVRALAAGGFRLAISGAVGQNVPGRWYRGNESGLAVTPVLSCARSQRWFNRLEANLPRAGREHSPPDSELGMRDGHVPVRRAARSGPMALVAGRRAIVVTGARVLAQCLR